MWWALRKRPRPEHAATALLRFGTSVRAIHPDSPPKDKLDLFDAVRGCLRLMLGREPTDAETRGVYDPDYVPQVVETQPDPEIPFEFEP
ncbi:MAG: hypothetical protein U0797_08220 [Gemmataceae bacterium]